MASSFLEFLTPSRMLISSSSAGRKVVEAMRRLEPPTFFDFLISCSSLLSFSISLLRFSISFSSAKIRCFFSSSSFSSFLVCCRVSELRLGAKALDSSWGLQRESELLVLMGLRSQIWRVWWNCSQMIWRGSTSLSSKKSAARMLLRLKQFSMMLLMMELEAWEFSKTENSSRMGMSVVRLILLSCRKLRLSSSALRLFSKWKAFSSWSSSSFWKQNSRISRFSISSLLFAIYCFIDSLQSSISSSLITRYISFSSCTEHAISWSPYSDRSTCIKACSGSADRSTSMTSGSRAEKKAESMARQAMMRLSLVEAVMMEMSAKVSCWKFSSILGFIQVLILIIPQSITLQPMSPRLLLLLALCLPALATLQDTIDCVKAYIQTFEHSLDPKLFAIFKNSFPNTLETTIQSYDLTPEQERTYIITGDIEAMWLRDSTNQFLPYIRIPKRCPNIEALSKGLLNTQAEFIMLDGYTNAFKRFETDKKKRPFYLNDISETLLMGISVDLCRKKEYATEAIWERKFEIDSLASFLRLSYEHYRSFQNIDFVNLRYIKALRRLMAVLEEQSHDEPYEKENNSTFYTFYRDARELPGGHIRPSRRTGMIKTGFRPSDDPNQLPYNVPGNAMASTYLRYVAEFVLSKIPEKSVFFNSAQILISKMKRMSEQIRDGIFKYGIVEQANGPMFAYEVDGMGNNRLYDDANLPSLVSLPYFEFVEPTNPLYQNTRAFLLSVKNKYFYSHQNIRGIGSSHTAPNYIWPLALMTQIMTSSSEPEISNCLNSLVVSAKNNLMHESFSVDNPQAITRDWFAWANSFFGETIVFLQEKYPGVLAKRKM